MVEGSDLTLDTAMYVQGDGGERILVPVRPEPPPQGSAPMNAKPESEPNPDVLLDFQQDTDILT